MSNQESTEMKVTVKVQTSSTDSSGESGKSATLNLNSQRAENTGESILMPDDEGLSEAELMVYIEESQAEIEQWTKELEYCKKDEGA